MKSFFELTKQTLLNDPIEALIAYQQLCKVDAPRLQAKAYIKWYGKLFELFQSKKDYHRACELAYAVATQQGNKKDKDAAYTALKRLFVNYPQAMYYMIATKLHLPPGLDTKKTEETLLQRSPLKNIPFWARFFKFISSNKIDLELLTKLTIMSRIEQLASHSNDDINKPYQALSLAFKFESHPCKTPAEEAEYRRITQNLLQNCLTAQQFAPDLKTAQNAQNAFGLIAAMINNIELLVNLAEDLMKEIQYHKFKTPINHETALGLFSLAADDNVLAQARLAMMYLNPLPSLTMQDLAKAQKLADAAYETIQKKENQKIDPRTMRFFHLSHAAALCARFYFDSKISFFERALQSAFYAITHMPPNSSKGNDKWDDAYCYLILAAFNIQGIAAKFNYKPQKESINFINAANLVIQYLRFAPYEEILLNNQDPNSTLAIVIKNLTNLANNGNSAEAKDRLEKLTLWFKDNGLKYQLLKTSDPTIAFTDLKDKPIPVSSKTHTTTYIIHGAYDEQKDSSGASSCSTDPDH